MYGTLAFAGQLLRARLANYRNQAFLRISYSQGRSTTKESQRRELRPS